MEPQEDRPDLGTTERNALRDRLVRCGALQLAQAYEGAVRLLAQPAFPARRHLLAHLVREIMNGLPDVVTGMLFEHEDDDAIKKLAVAWRKEVPERPQFAAPLTMQPPGASVTISATLAARVSVLMARQERPTPRKKHELLMERLRPGSAALRPALEPVILRWLADAKRFVATAHLPRGTAARRRRRRKDTSIKSEAELLRLFQSFEDGLRGILAGHFEVTKEIDAILDSSPPGDETLQRLMPLLGGAQQLQHFFNRIDDPAWLEPLEREDFFAHAPGAVVRETDAGKTTWFPDWPALQFLVRMASIEDAQEHVTRIALALDDAGNPWVQGGVGDVALQLAPPLATKLTSRLVKWLKSSYLDFSHLDDKLSALSVRFAEAGQADMALSLLRTLTGRPRLDARGKPAALDPWQLQELFHRHLDPVVTHLGFDAVTTLCGALVQEIRADNGAAVEPGSREDRGHVVLRPAVERSDGAPSTLGELVGAVARAATAWVGQDAARLAAVVAHLEAERWLVFQRIAFFLLASTPDAPADLVAARLLDRKLFDAFDRIREYRLLLQKRFSALSESEQRQVLDWIEVGPDEVALRHQCA